MNSLGNVFGTFTGLFCSVQILEASLIRHSVVFASLFIPDQIYWSGGCWLYNTVRRKTNGINNRMICELPDRHPMTVFFYTWGYRNAKNIYITAYFIC